MSRLSRLSAVVLAVLSCMAVASPAGASEREFAPPEFVALHDIDPSIRYDIRYFGRHNFVGDPIDGYWQPECVLTRQAASALSAAQRALLSQGYTLKVYDCYRPQRAVDHFVRWANDLDDERMKAEFYPNVDKTRLFADGYIAEKSGHSRGSTLDVTLVELPVGPQRPYVPGEPLVACFAPAGQRFPDNTVDMGTGYDCFDPLSHTDNPAITGTARHHRDLLRATLANAGFRNLAEEWWHYTLNNEPFPDTYFNFPVTRCALT